MFGPDRKMCIFIENGLFPQFLRHNINQYMQLVEKVCDVKYCVRDVLLFCKTCTAVLYDMYCCSV